MGVPGMKFSSSGRRFGGWSLEQGCPGTIWQPMRLRFLGIWRWLNTQFRMGVVGKNPYTCAFAAKYGHRAIVKWMIGNGCGSILFESFWKCCLMCDMKMLKWLRKKVGKRAWFPWNAQTCIKHITEQPYLTSWVQRFYGGDPPFTMTCSSTIILFRVITF